MQTKSVCEKMQQLTTTVKVNKTYCHITTIVAQHTPQSQDKEKPTRWSVEFLWRSV